MAVAKSGTTTPHHTELSRPLVLLHPSSSTRVSVSTPSSAASWTAAEVARDTFHDWLHEQDTAGHLVGFEAAELDEDNPAAATDARTERELVLTSYWLEHLAGLLNFPSGTSEATAQVLDASFRHLDAHFLASTDVHSLAAALAAPVRALVISSYYHARTKLQVAGIDLPAPHGGALLAEASAGTAELYAVFGGQGMNEVYFDELQVRFRFLAAGSRSGTLT